MSPIGEPTVEPRVGGDLRAFRSGPWPAWYAQTDALGIVRGIASGVTYYRRYEYDEWGVGTSLETGSPLAGDLDRARWKGALYAAPEAGLYYLRNRWYEPRSGRFVSEDPIGLAGGINPYAFAGADPVGGSDPAGLRGNCTTLRYPNGFVQHAETGACGSEDAHRLLTAFCMQIERLDYCHPDTPLQVPDWPSPVGDTTRWTQCATLMANGVAAVAIDFATFYLGSGAINFVRNAGSLGRGTRLAVAAGRMAGTRRGLTEAAIALGERQTASNITVGTMSTLMVSTMRGALLGPEPDYGRAYAWAKRFPFLGAGIRLGEGVNACMGS